MSAPALSPPPDSNQNSGPQLLAIYWVQGGIAILVVALRFYVRYIKRIIGIEDWVMLICLILFITGSALLPNLIHYRVGRHVYSISPEHLSQAVRWHWIIQSFEIMALPFGKISVAIFLLKLRGPNKFWRKWLLYTNMIVFTLLASLCVIFIYVQCNPPRALWEEIPGAKCWAPDGQINFSIATHSFSALFDYELGLLPITILWNFKIGIKRKMGLYILLGTSLLSGNSATLKTIQFIELFVNILCGSIPILKPLYDKWAHGRAIAPSNRSRSSGLKNSAKSSKQASKSLVFKNHFSTPVENLQYNIVFGQAITVVESVDA